MELADVLEDRWSLTFDHVEVLDGGMNSQTWLVVAEGLKVVAKSVDRSDDGFEPGLELAARLGRAGVVTGAPVVSRSGRLVERWGDRQVAVLEFVDGVPLVGTTEDLRAMGTTLGRVHGISRGPAGELEKWFGMITQFDVHLDLEPWIRPAVEGALDGVREVAARQELTWAGLHGDPAPDAFLRQASGEVALIDWGGGSIAPALYDVGSAVMYVGTEEHVVAAYLAQQPAMATEVSAGLQAFLTFRYAVQAAYFAWRIDTDVQTGVTAGNDNLKGLADARRSLTT